MREKFKHWAWRTLLTLTCLLITTPAWATWYLFGDIGGNTWTYNPQTAMTDNGNGTWTWTGVISGQKYFAFANNTANDWNTFNNNYRFSSNGTVTEGVTAYATVKGDYTSIFTGDGSNYNVTFDESNKSFIINKAADTWTVAGSQALFGSEWSTTDTSNDMTTTDGVTYTWSKENVTLNQGTIEFKVVKNHSWDTAYPASNYQLNIPSNGAYNVTITFDSSTKEINATLTPLFVTAPVFSPEAGNYDCNQNVTITAGAGTIYYTTDGSDPATSETRMEYTAPVAVHGEGEHVIKAVTVNGDEISEVATAEYNIKFVNVYLFGSVGKAHAWVYSASSNPELATSDGITYSGVHNVNGSNDYTERGLDYGLFLLTTDFGTTFDTTVPYVIGAKDSDGNFWFNDEHFRQTLPTENGNKNGWSIIKGTYEFFYNRVENTLRVEKFDGPTIYVYDYSRPYIYVEDKNGTPFDGEQPGNPIQTLDETVGGHRDLSAAGDGSGDGKGQLGWYKFAVPVHPANCPVKFQFHHNGDKTITHSGKYTTSSDAYYYWNGEEYLPIAKDDVNKLRRIVAHVRVQGTTVPMCNNVEMNGPSSFYGQMYYWMAVTTYDKGERFVITDGTHNYDYTITSDVYLEWDENSGTNYKLIDETTLNHRMDNKTGRGTLIHLLKNKNTPTNNGDYVLGVDTQVTVGNKHTNTTNLGATWWGSSLNNDNEPWQGTFSYSNGVLSNYNGSRFLYMASGVKGNPDVFVTTSEDGQEWYTWYSDRSTATIKFGYGTPKEGYPDKYITGGEGAPEHPENVYKFYANYESPQTQQTAGEVWYVWTPDFNANLNDANQSQNNGTLLDVTRTYESRAKQKALCSTFRDGDYVYYTDIKGWGDEKVWCYVWDKNGNAITPWPGVQMIKVGYDDEGHPVYLADLSNYDVTNADGIIFNNGVKDDHATDKRQTGDLPWENHGCYDYLGLLYRIGGNTDVIDNEPYGENSYLTLRGVWYSRVKGTLFAKGDNDYNNKSVNGYGYVDFAKTATDGSSTTPLQSWDYDQSNWVEIYPSLDGKTVTTEDLINLLNKEFTLYGTKQKSVNPTFTAVSISNVGGEKAYEPNHFTPAHFNGSPYQMQNGENEWYFFVEPKPNEFGQIYWTIYSEANDAFYALKSTGFTGTINVDWSYHDPYYKNGQNMIEPFMDNQADECGKKPELEDLNGYSGWYAIIKFAEETSETNPSAKNATGTQYENSDVAPSTNAVNKYTVYPICLTDEYIITGIETIGADKGAGVRSLKSTRYYNLMGVESGTPFEGVNIVVKEYSDGTRESSKMIVR